MTKWTSCRRRDFIRRLQKVNLSPKEMETAINKAVKETTERLNLEAKNREELMKKEFIGEKNVLTTRIESLEKTAKEQSAQISGLINF